jgi:hypothetical protein
MSGTIAYPAVATTKLANSCAYLFLLFVVVFGQLKVGVFQGRQDGAPGGQHAAEVATSRTNAARRTPFADPHGIHRHRGHGRREAAGWNEAQDGKGDSGLGEPHGCTDGGEPNRDQCLRPFNDLDSPMLNEVFSSWQKSRAAEKKRVPVDVR